MPDLIPSEATQAGRIRQSAESGERCKGCHVLRSESEREWVVTYPGSPFYEHGEVYCLRRRGVGRG